MTKRLRILALGLMIVVLLATLSGCSVDGVKDKIMGIIGPYLPGCQHEGGEATCTTQAVCEKCGVAYGNVLGHDIVVDAAVAPDCENAGLTEGKHCSRCDYTSGREVVDALGHNVVVDAAVPATCYSTGLTEGKHCDRCEEVLVAQTETTMIPHTYDEEGFDETCNAEGCTHVRTCAHDGEKTVVAGKAPTCTVAGLTDGETCAICGDVTKAQEVIDALGHDMAEATCTAPATCKRGCGHTVGTSKGHSYDDGVVTTAPTCTEKGVKTYTCSACGDSYTEEVAAAGHSHQPKVTAPTCTEDGYITYTCSCGDSYTAPGQASTGHAWGEWVIDVEPTEETEGAKHRDCTNCDEVETAVIPELSHVHSYTTTVVAPTCTEKGYTKHTCRCGDTYNTDEVDALGHDEKTVTVDPTCTEAGSTTTTCTRCDYNNVTPLPATNHTYESVVTAPKCEEDGYTTHTCHCGDSYVDTYVDALGHKDEDHNHACDNGCNVYQGTHADGDDADHLCDHGCGATLSEHSYSSEVTAPTCTVDGYTTYTCACGDTYTSDVVAAKGHSYSSEVTAPTCTVDGYTTYTCACGHSYTDDETPAAGHSWDNGEITTAPKCGVAGEKTYHCTVCDDGIKTEPVDALTHDWKHAVCQNNCGTAFESEVVFDLGKNGTAGSHTNGTDIKYPLSYTVNGYTLTFTAGSKAYQNEIDLKGNSTIKLGTSSAVGTITFTVPEGVSEITIFVAKYKAKDTKVSINGTEYVISTSSDNGEYTPITVDTTTTKTVTVATVGTNYRAIIDKIVFYATVVHDCNDYIQEDAQVDPTCQNTGVAAGAHCEFCGEIISGYDELPEVDHDYVDGECKWCQRPEHECDYTYSVVITDPTCKADGYTTNTCECGNYQITNVTERVDHKDETGDDFVCDYGCGEKMLPADGESLTIEQALTIAKLMGNTYTTQKYYITGVINNVYDTTYGNMYIEDADGNEICVYGLYDYTGKVRYDAMTYKPVVGDEVTVYTVLGCYKDAPQGKDAWLDEVVAHEHNYQSEVTAPTCTKGGYTTHTCTICNEYYVDNETEATGHSTENGTCEYCGQTIGGDVPDLEEKTYSYKFTAKQFSSNTTKTLGGVDWTLAGDATYFGIASSSDGRGHQFGSKKQPCTNLTLTSDEFSNVSQVTVNASCYSSGTLKVYVGNTLVGTANITKTATEYSFDVSGLTGEVKFVFTNTSRAMYVLSFAVEYAE